MNPQDPQMPINDPNAAAPVQPGADLSAQIPASYAPAATPAPATSGGSVLQDALDAQMNVGAAVAAAAAPLAAPAPSVAPGSPQDAAIDAHIASDEPDPMAGFAATAAVAPVAPAAPEPLPVAPVPAPAVAEVAAPVEPTQPVQPAGPAPAVTQAYDPSQDAGVGAPASSYPAAPEPLPPNPLEMDAATAPPAPMMPEPAYVAPEPAPMPVMAPVAAPQPAMVEPSPVQPEQLPVDPAAGIPAQPGVDPTLQSMLEDPQAASAAEVDPYSDPSLMAAATPSSSKGGGKGVLMSVGIGAAVLIFGIIVLALILGKKTTTEVPADSLSGDQQSTQSKSTEPTITAPEGYVAIVKDCYEFAIPTDNTIATDDTSCKIDATFGAQATSTIAVAPSITTYDNLEKAVTASKEANKITAANTVSERQITFGGFDAKEVVYNAGTTAAPQNKTLIVVTLKGKSYKLDGKTITAIEVNMTSNDDFTKKAVATLESTWSWK